MYKLDVQARKVQDLQDQKNALIDSLYKPVVPQEMLNKLTPDQKIALQSGKRDMIDSQIRSINNQIDGRYKEADSMVQYLNSAQEQMQKAEEQLLDLLKDPEGQNFLKSNLSEEGRALLSSRGIDIDAYTPSTGGTLAQRNNNPGNIKDPATGKFKVFRTIDEGKQAWLDDFKLKATGGSRTRLQPTSTLAEYIATYAPASDNNDVQSYINSVVKQTGIDPNSTISDILASGNAQRLGEAMFNHEGFYNDTQASTAYRNQVMNSRIASADKKSIIADIDALVSSGATAEEIDQVALDGLFSRASDKQKQVYNEALYANSAIDAVLSEIDSGNFTQEAGVLGQSYKNALRSFGEESPYGAMVRALFTATTAERRHELFGAALTDNEQQIATDFLPTTSDNEDVLRVKLQALRDIYTISQKTALGLRADDTVAEIAAAHKKSLKSLKNGGAVSKTPSVGETIDIGGITITRIE
jgi:hypothetical protein